MTTPTIVLIFASATALLGGWALRRGWRGVRVGDHPHCRRCDFDLFGRPAGSDVCPECGADVRHPRAVAVGERRRRPRLAAAGALVLLCGLAGAAFVGTGLARNTAWERYKPVAWLIHDGRGADTAARNVAIAELLRRQQDGTLSARQVSAVVDAALKVQADRATAWDFRWGDFVEAARQSNGVTDAQWRTYVGQAVSVDYAWLSVTARPSTREVPHAHLETRRARVGRGESFRAHVRALAILVDGREYLGLMDDRDGTDVATVSASGSGSRGGTRHDFREALRGLPPGRHSGYFVYEIRVTPSQQLRRTPTPRTTSSARDSSATRFKRMYAEAHAVWSDAGRASAIAVARVQIPFELELVEGSGPLRGSNAARGPARPAEPLSPEVEKLVDARVAREAEARTRLLSVEPDDLATAAETLDHPDGGVIKLLPHKKYPQELLGMHGGGAYFDFARRSQHYRTGREMCLRDGKFACSYGFFLDLGDVAPTDLANLTEAPPPWADEAMKRRWRDFWGPDDERPLELAKSLGKSEQRGGPPAVPALAGHAYLFRSVDDVLDTELLIGLRVLRICDDGAAVVAYRILKEFDGPRRR